MIYSSNRVTEREGDEENEKLNQLIEDYRRENERCTSKIHELQEKLHATGKKVQKDKAVSRGDGLSHNGMNWN